MTLQLRVPNAAAFVENLTNEAMIVITDPDDCIDMSHFSPIGPFETCPGGPNESVHRFPVGTDPTSRHSSTRARRIVSQRLIDDEFDSSNILGLNKPYLLAGNVLRFGGNTDGILVAASGRRLHRRNRGEHFGLPGLLRPRGRRRSARVGPDGGHRADACFRRELRPRGRAASAISRAC